MKRIIGLILLVAGLLGIGVGIGGITQGSDAIDRLGETLKQQLPMTSANLAATGDALAQAQSSIQEVQGSIQDALGNTKDSLNLVKALLGEVNATVGNLQLAIAEATANVDNVQNLLDEVALRVAVELPDTVDKSLDDLLPDLLQEINTMGRNPLLITFNAAPLFEALNEGLTDTQANVNEQTDSLRAMGDAFDLELADVIVNIETIAEDLGDVNMQIAEFEGLIDQYIATIEEIEASLNATLDPLGPMLEGYVNQIDAINSTIQAVEGGLDQGLDRAKTGVTILMLWLILVNLAPLYLGWELLRGKGMRAE